MSGMNFVKIGEMFYIIHTDFCDLTFLFCFTTEGCNLQEFAYFLMCPFVYLSPLSHTSGKYFIKFLALSQNC
jgi:hypothetical protein